MLVQLVFHRPVTDGSLRSGLMSRRQEVFWIFFVSVSQLYLAKFMFQQYFKTSKGLCTIKADGFCFCQVINH